MSDENNKIVPASQNNKLGTFNQPGAVGMKGRLQQAKAQGTLASENLIDFKNFSNRIVIALDDSGSMSRSMSMSDEEWDWDTKSPDSRMSLAIKACEGFLQVCNPSDTVVGLYTISTSKVTHLNWNYKEIEDLLKEIQATGGTPTFIILNKILSDENLTRAVVISDGCSDSGVDHVLLRRYKEKNIIIDAVFIGVDSDHRGIAEMKEIAEVTGGQFIHFKDANDFKSKFKYLAPAYYGLLQSGSLKI